MSSALPKPPAASASRPQTGVANGRPSTSTTRPASSTVRLEHSSLARPASASISHLLGQPASFSSFVKEARRHRYEDAASSTAVSATQMPTSRPRTSQQVTFQPSVLASTNQLEGALASNIMRYKGAGSGHQPAPAVDSGNLAAIASKGHPPAPGAVQRLNRPRDTSPRSTFIDASRPPARLDSARSSSSAADTMRVVPQPPADKPAAAKRAPARRAVANLSPAKQKEQKSSVQLSAGEVPSLASAEGGTKKKKTKARKRAPVILAVPSSAISVFSLDNAAPVLNSAGAFLKSRQQSR